MSEQPLTPKSAEIARLRAEIAILKEAAILSLDADVPPDRNPVVEYTDNMTYGEFVMANENADANPNYYYGYGWSLAFYLTAFVPGPVFNTMKERTERYYRFMMLMIESGLCPNLRFQQRRLLRAIKDTMVCLERTRSKEKVSAAAQADIDHRLRRYGEVCDALVARGAVV
jgi:hypothetical protein